MSDLLKLFQTFLFLEHHSILIHDTVHYFSLFILKNTDCDIVTAS